MSPFLPLPPPGPPQDELWSVKSHVSSSQFSSENKENRLPLGNYKFLEAPPVDTRNPRYKTEICRNFKERSKCIYGDNCQFAHGKRELREVVRYENVVSDYQPEQILK